MYSPFLCYQFDLVGTGCLHSITQAFISSVSRPFSGQSLCFHAALNPWGSLYGPTSSFAGPVRRVNKNQCNQGCFDSIMFFSGLQDLCFVQRRFVLSSVLCLWSLRQVLDVSSRRLMSQLSWSVTLLRLSMLHALSVRRPLSLSLVVQTFRSLQDCLCHF